MAFSIIRKATNEDFDRVAKSAVRFCKRHNIKRINIDTVIEDIEYWIDFESYPEDRAYRRRLWACCLARALRTEVRVNLTVTYGYVGLRV